MDQFIFYLEKSSPRTQGKLLTIFFKQDKKPFKKKKGPSDTGRINTKILLSVGLVSTAHRWAAADPKSQVNKD